MPAETSTKSAYEPKLLPTKWASFSYSISLILTAEFQDVATFAFHGTVPDYQKYTPAEMLVYEGHDLNATGWEQICLSERLKDLLKKRRDYEDGCVSFYDRLMLHLSQDSIVLLKSHVEEYQKVSRTKNPHDLWHLLQKSHTIESTVVSKEEKEQAVKRLKDLRQVTGNGTVPLKTYNQAWNKVHAQALTIKADVGTVPELVEMYLLSLNQADLGNSVAGKIHEKNLPVSIAAAQIWALERAAVVRRINPPSEVSQTKRSYVQTSMANPASAIILPESKKSRPNPSTSSSKEPTAPCQFCNLKNHSIQQCFFFRTYKEEHGTEIANFVKEAQGNTATHSPLTYGHS